MQVKVGDEVWVIIRIASSDAYLDLILAKRVISKPVKDIPGDWWVTKLNGDGAGAYDEEHMYGSKQEALDVAIKQIY